MYVCKIRYIQVWSRRIDMSDVEMKAMIKNSAGPGGKRCETESKTKIKIYGHHQKRYKEEWADGRQHSWPQGLANGSIQLPMIRCYWCGTAINSRQEGEKICKYSGNVHIPNTLAGWRNICKTHVHLQDIISVNSSERKSGKSGRKSVKSCSWYYFPGGVTGNVVHRLDATRILP